MPAIEESLRNVVGRQRAAFSWVLNETSSIKVVIERVLKAQEEQALQELTVTTTTTVSPRNMASVFVLSKPPPLSSSDATVLASGSALLLKGPFPVTMHKPGRLLTMFARSCRGQAVCLPGLKPECLIVRRQGVFAFTPISKHCNDRSIAHDIEYEYTYITQYVAKVEIEQLNEEATLKRFIYQFKLLPIHEFQYSLRPKTHDSANTCRGARP